MHDLPIEMYGSPILRAKAGEVTVFGEALGEFIHAMFRTMYRARGQGLAAPQVGESKRIVVIDLPEEDSPAFVLVNPVIVSVGSTTSRHEEGCLSLPGVSARVKRPTEIVVDARDAKGDTLHIEASGDLARCMQHEIEHLDGILYIDHLSYLERQLVLKRYEKLLRRQRA